MLLLLSPTSIRFVSNGNSRRNDDIVTCFYHLYIYIFYFDGNSSHHALSSCATCPAKTNVAIDSTSGRNEFLPWLARSSCCLSVGTFAERNLPGCDMEPLVIIDFHIEAP